MTRIICSDAVGMLETALWSTTDYNDNNLDDKFSISDIPLEFQEKVQDIVDKFLVDAAHLLTQDELDDNPIGHDIWLTVHGHGAGFWDGDYEQGDELTKLCENIEELEDELRELLT